MERGKETSFILRQFKRKSKRILSKDFFTEFFYLNKDRKVIEFLFQNGVSNIEYFFKEFLPAEFRDFVKVRILNEVEDEVKIWYYGEENLVLVIEVNWGFKKQEISVDIDIDNFILTVIDDKEKIVKKIDYVMFNDYLISFLTLQARALAQTFEAIAQREKKKV